MSFFTAAEFHNLKNIHILIYWEKILTCMITITEHQSISFIWKLFFCSHFPYDLSTIINKNERHKSMIFSFLNILEKWTKITFTTVLSQYHFISDLKCQQNPSGFWLVHQQTDSALHGVGGNKEVKGMIFIPSGAYYLVKR